ncbi:hypothetical protein QCE80_14265 [Staphylococcus aureus]|nr:hypothetical protein [Staphylococcus aureus]
MLHGCIIGNRVLVCA